MGMRALILLCCGALVALGQAPAQPAGQDKPAVRAIDALSGKVRFDAQLARWGWRGDVLEQGGKGFDPASGKPRALPAPSAAAAASARALQAHRRALQALDGKLRGRRGLDLRRAQRGEDWLLLSHARGVFFHRVGHRAVRLGSRQALAWAHASSDGRRVAAVCDHDLVVLALSPSGQRSGLEPITDDGSPTLRNGVLDWVTQEEVYGRGSWRAFWWRSDGRALAFLQLDGADVPRLPLVDLRDDSLQQQSYPRAGEPNPRVRLGVVDWPSAGAAPRLRWLPLERFGRQQLIARVEWAPDGRLLVGVSDRTQTRWSLLAVELASLRSSQLLSEAAPAGKGWVSRPPSVRWLPQGGFLYGDESSGYRHLVHVGPDGKRTQLTRGEWPVRRVLRVDEASVWFTASPQDATQNHVFRVPLDGGAEPVQLTKAPGWHSVAISADGRWLIDRWSALDDPGRVALLGRDGEPIRELARATVPGRDRWRYTAPTALRIRCADGFVLDGSLITPPQASAERPAAVMLRTYSGPDAPSVRHRWNSSAYDQLLVAHNIAVLRVNVRSASGRGLAITRACYRQLGVQELADLETAVAEVTKAPHLDAGRVGIEGSSYGGFMAAFALTHSKRFRLGLAMSGVYDWRLYDTIYTERYMDRPQANKAGYDRTSCIKAAANLHGHLVLVHGTQDDNVHLTNAMRFALALQRAGKPFEMMIYPGMGHGIWGPQGRHLAQLRWDAIRRHLLPD